MYNQEKMIILMPVYNDWESFILLVERIKIHLLNFEFSILVVNDGSSIEIPSKKEFSSLNVNIETLNLIRNVGHQKAISIGLSYINQNKEFEFVIVMDSDGEDDPIDILKLIKEGLNNPNKINFADRNKRKERLQFLFFYKIYKLIFRILTGSSISFGNFSLIPKNLLENVVNISEIWTHYSAGVLFSKIPYRAIPIDRSVRLAGVSKMKLPDLVLHGLGAISVQSSLVMVRILLFSLFLVTQCFLGLGIAFGIKMFTDQAIPGWLTSVTFGLTIIMIQVLMSSIFMIFIVSNNKSQRLFTPSLDYIPLVKNILKTT